MFFNRKDGFDFHRAIKMVFDLLQFTNQMFTDSRCDFNVMACRVVRSYEPPLNQRIVPNFQHSKRSLVENRWAMMTETTPRACPQDTTM